FPFNDLTAMAKTLVHKPGSSFIKIPCYDGFFELLLPPGQPFLRRSVPTDQQGSLFPGHPMINGSKIPGWYLNYILFIIFKFIAWQKPSIGSSSDKNLSGHLF